MVKLEENYFSETLKWTIIILGIAFGAYLLFMDSYQWLIIIFGLLIAVSVSTKYSFVVDTANKRIKDSFYILWINTQSETVTYNILQGIRLDKVRHNYNSSTRSRDRNTDFNEYIASLEYDQGKLIELTRNTEYQVVADEMIRLADQLKLTISRTF